jgi:hypothetical protein
VDDPLRAAGDREGVKTGRPRPHVFAERDRVLIELYTEMDVFIPELGMCEARPWHEHFPMKPRAWKLTELNAWGAEYAFSLGEG